MVSNGTAFAAFTTVALGVWLIDSGIQGRHPISTLEDILRNPSNTRATLTADKGKFGTVQDALGNGGVQSGSYSGPGGSFVPDGSSAPTPATPTNKQVAAEQKYAASQLSKYGWGQDQLAPLIDLWNEESGWNPTANNSSSGAFGIPQSLPGDKMASAGADWRTNYKTQINWGLKYIKDRYGSPEAAYQFENSHSPHWY